MLPDRSWKTLAELWKAVGEEPPLATDQPCLSKSSRVYRK
ncbi:hypothetical protein EV14_0030 [Prochlorococcus sp. MIT 0703]|nr:hypothetical protein EV12_0938 [Prochlorococcus sp. MIT 0701]KGG37238.1 hypothetical protein EV14_0030 [Prochlorococcus sp. MIT 0703]